MSLDADDLAMLATGFEAAMTGSSPSADAEAALFELGWADVLSVDPLGGARAAFTLLGSTGSTAALLDDVMAAALGLDASTALCLAFSVPHRAGPPGRIVDGMLVVEGLVSSRIDSADTVVVVAFDPVTNDTNVFVLDAGQLRGGPTAALDPSPTFRRVSASIPLDRTTPIAITGEWATAVALARVALAHQLIAAARWMLATARQHALDRVQFGKPIAAFQSIRHKLAESFVAIEGAASVVAAYEELSDPLVAALSKSAAGKAARTTATHAQQILGGIGFTTDHEFQQWLKRVLVIDTVFGSSTSLPTEIGTELLRRGEAPRLIEL